MRITGDGIWGAPDDRDGAIALLRRVVELGVNLIDTADSYGPEVSEDLIAEALHPYPADLVIATKGGLTRDGPGKWPARRPPRAPQGACEGSLRRPEGRDDRPLPAARARTRGAVRGVGRARWRSCSDEGKVRHVGVSNVALEQLGRRASIVAVVSVQNRYNLTDRDSRTCSRRARSGSGSSPGSRSRRAAWSPTGARSTRSRSARRDARPGGARVAARPLPGDAADPGHVVDRAPRGERSRDRAHAHGRRARDDCSRRLGVGASNAKHS